MLTYSEKNLEGKNLLSGTHSAEC